MTVILSKSCKTNGVTVTLQVLKETEKAKQIQYIISTIDGKTTFKSKKAWIPKKSIISEDDKQIQLKDWVLKYKKEFFNDIPTTLYSIQKEEIKGEEKIKSEAPGKSEIPEVYKMLKCDSCGKPMIYPKYILYEFDDPYKIKPWYFCRWSCLARWMEEE
ncbi:MAG: hypothetical protein ABIM44_08985 [candidate division WOR-3 bacterium]